jgi:hypothetical protein
MSEETVHDEPAPELDEPAAPSRRRRRDRPGFWVKLAIAGLMVLGISAIGFASQTSTGQRLVMEELLARVRAELAGELRVGDVRSEMLLAGFTLTEVGLDAEGGQHVLEADSLVVRFSLLSLLVGSPQVRSATVYGLALEVSRAPGADALNVQRIMAPGVGGDSTSSSPFTIELGRISVRDGSVTVLMPVAEATAMTVPGPDGTPMRRIAFDDLDLDLEETVLRPGGAVELDARLTSFSSRVHILEEPLVVQAAVASVTFGAEGLRLDDGAFRLPSALLEGDLGFGPQGPERAWTFAANLTTDDWASLSDLQWIDSRIPDGRVRGEARLRTGDGLVVDLRGVEVQTGASELTATGSVRFDEGMTLSQLVLTASPLATADLGPWVEGEVPVDGFVSGQATLSGTPDELHVDGRMTLVPTGIIGTPSTADISGTLYFGDDPGAQDLEVRLDPLNYSILQPYWANAASLGEGSGTIEVDGRVGDGLLVIADLTHEGDSVAVSRVYGEGRLRREPSGEWTTEVRADLAPLSLELVGLVRPDLGLRGWVSGPVQVDGSFDDLAFRGDLLAGDGRLVVEGQMDAITLGAGYALDLTADTVDLSAITSRAPESVISGRMTVQGSGFVVDSLEGIASATLGPSSIGEVRITSASTNLRATGGLLLLDSVDLNVAGVRAIGSGTLGLTPTSGGSATFTFEVDSLGAFRSMVMGDSILVRDGLSPLEEDLLRVRGIEPDTLPEALDVRMTGSARGIGELTGNIRDMGVRLEFDAVDVAYRHNQLDSARVELTGSGLPDLSGDWLAMIRAFGIDWESRIFEAVDFDGTMSQQRGEGTLNVSRRAGESYFATGSFVLDSLGGEVALSDASLQIDDLSWVLANPSRIAWDSTAVHVDSLQLRRTGDDPSLVTAQGTLARGGESNFRLDMDGFHVEDATRILQREDLDLFGHVDLSLTVLGPAENPRLDALFQVDDPVYGALALDRLTGSIEYRDRSSDFRVDAWDRDVNVLSATGTLPLDLALIDVEARTLDQPMDIEVRAESFAAAIALAYFGTLEDVAGTMSANLHIGGTSREPEPSGTIRLDGGAWTISALGVRHTGISGELDLQPDRTVNVDVATATGGRSTITGVLTMIPFANPALDLQVTLDQFQAVSRRDIESVLSGSFTVTGEYRLPVAQGALRVDEGTLFVDEFARNAAVVDLRDPMLLSEGFAVDTTVFVTQPILANLRNPFLDNLRVDIDLSVPRNLWLRSTEMNVEMGGDLLVRYDRAVNDLVMVGDLQALRGSYQVLGRTFEVDGGTVSFLGQPGVNPTLGIEALSRVRRRGGDRLDVRATVTGTLVQPLVTLSTTEAGVSQTDLVSYLLFGVPGGELGTGGGLGVGASTIASGTVGNQLGTALAEQIGVIDYFAVSQGDALTDANVTANFFNSLATAQYEVGTYLSDDVFVVVVLNRTTGEATAPDTGLGGVNFWRGLRVELALSEEWFVEGFLEDRFLRSSGGLGQTGLDGENIVGVLVFRDWGYGSQ